MRAVRQLVLVHRVALASAFWLSLAAALGSLAVASVLARTVDRALHGEVSFTTLLALAALGVARIVLVLAQSLVSVHLAHRVATELRTRLLERALGAEATRWSAQELATRVSHDVTAVQALLAFRAPTVLADLLAGVALVGFATSRDPLTVSVAAAPLLLASVPAWLASRRASASADVARSEYGRLVEHTVEAIGAGALIRQHGAVTGVLTRLEHELVAFESTALRARTWAVVASPVVQVAALLGALSSLGVLASRVGAHSIDSEAALSLVAALSLAARPIVRLASAPSDVAAFSPPLSRIDALLATDAVPSSAQSVVVSPGLERLSLRAATLRRGERVVLQDVDLEIGKGDKVAVVGKNGAGKSTLLEALVGVSAVEGELRVDGRSVTSFEAIAAWVPQEPSLFEGTLLSNVTLGDEAPDRHRASRALDLAGTSFDDRGGLDAIVERSGRNFSIGERQRVCLARAFYRRRPLWVFDEPTAPLDDEHARSFTTDLGRALDDASVTLVIATHDPAVIERCTVVLEVGDGRVSRRLGRPPTERDRPSE